jgi:hypothetical protein
MARLSRRARIIRNTSIGVLFVVGAAVLGMSIYQARLERSERLEYQPGTLEYWLLAPSVLKRVPSVAPVSDTSFVYEFRDDYTYVELWNWVSYRSAAQETELDRILFRYFESEGYVENPDRDHLERELGDEYSELSYALEPVDGGTDVIVSHVAIRAVKTSLWKKALHWLAGAFGK